MYDYHFEFIYIVYVEDCFLEIWTCNKARGVLFKACIISS